MKMIRDVSELPSKSCLTCINCLKTDTLTIDTGPYTLYLTCEDEHQMKSKLEDGPCEGYGWALSHDAVAAEYEEMLKELREESRKRKGLT
jgi:hypothetical protein